MTKYIVYFYWVLRLSNRNLYRESTGESGRRGVYDLVRSTPVMKTSDSPFLINNVLCPDWDLCSIESLYGSVPLVHSRSGLDWFQLVVPSVPLSSSISVDISQQVVDLHFCDL